VTAPSAAPPVRVLVVDDEADFATATAERLRRRGFLAVPVFAGREALERIAAEPFEAVLLDLRMPGMDGLAVLREIRRVDPHLRVIVLTGHGTVDSGIEGMQIGAADFLRKPADFESLVVAVLAAAEETRARRDAAPGGAR
jgi:DNA-binding NtrC family response regulator